MADMSAPRDERGRFIPYKTETILEKKLDKFSDVLSSIDMYVSKIFAINENQLSSMEEELERKRAQEEFDKLDKYKEEERTEQVEKSSQKSQEKENNSGINAFWGAIFGGLTGFMTKGNLLKGGMILAAAPFINKFVSDYIAETTKLIGFDEGTANSFGESAGLAGAAGLIGSLFGKRIGFIGAAGGAAFGLSDEVANAMGLDKDSVLSAFGMQIKAENALGSVMAVMMGASAFALSSASFWRGIASLAMASPLTAVARGFLPTAIASGMFMLHKQYGDSVKGYLQDIGANKAVADITVDGVSYATMGAAIGSLVPGIGTLIGALIGLGIGVLSSVTNWLRAKREENLENAISKYSDALSNWDDLTDDDKRKLQSEMDRDLQLSFADDLRENENFTEIQSRVGKRAVEEATINNDGSSFSLQRIIDPTVYNSDGSYTSEYNSLMQEASNFDTTPERRIEILSEIIRKLKSSNVALANAGNKEILEALMMTGSGFNNMPVLPEITEAFSNPEMESRVFSYRPISENTAAIAEAKMERIEEDVRNSGTTVVSAPVNTNNINIVQGGSSISSSTSNVFGGDGSRRRDPYGLPR